MSEILDKQVFYLGRWVTRDHFRTFVYNSTGQRLAKSYSEFSELISSGVWFAEVKDIPSEIPSSNDETLEQDEKVVDIQPKRGKKWRNPPKA